MLNRRTFLLVSSVLFVSLFAAVAFAEEPAAPKKKVATLIADWFPHSHPDVLLTCIFQTYTLDGKGEPSKLQLVSVYRDLPTVKDQSEKFAAENGFVVAKTMEEALTLGTGKLAVDGVIICTEWAPYPESPTGQIVYPHRKMFEACVKVFKESGRVVPVFIDKHLADTWEDSKWIYDTAKEMKIPIMAGSSLPVSWRVPAIDIPRGKPIKEIVGISYHTLTTYGFHGLEMVQTLAERRAHGETGIVSVQCLTDNAVWDAAGKEYDQELLDAALDKLERKISKAKPLRDQVPHPVLFIMDYADGLRVNLFTLNFVVNQWAAAWRYPDGKSESTLFWLDDNPPYGHFGRLMKGVEEMIVTGKPSWPAERTLMTSGVLDAALISKKGGQKMETPWLKFGYQCEWEWAAPAK
jgi:hypothetical protein